MPNKGVNKVILIGNLGQDPEIRYMTNGTAVSNISLATSEVWKDKKTGQIKEKTEWHKVVIFGKLAEIASEYLKKGSQVYIEGFLQTRKWKDRNGNDRYTTEILVNLNGSMKMLGGKNSLNLKDKNINENKKINDESNVLDYKDSFSDNSKNKSSDDFEEDDIPF